MSRTKLCLSLLVLALLGGASAQAADLTISIGLRETGDDLGSGGPAFGNAGFSGGIEWVNLDGQTLTVDGSWQQFTFTPAVDLLTGFAGATANSSLEIGHEWASLEHLRILNSDGITAPIALWIDDVSVNDSSGSTLEGFESFATGEEAIFQEPSFSGSTDTNIEAGSASVVTDGMAFTGTQSNRATFQFIDTDPTRWVRLTSFNTPNVPNPWVRIVEPGQADPTLTFWLKASENSLADLNGDVDVDGGDFLEIQRTDPSLISTWETDFGFGLGPLTGISNVPEPSSAVIALLAFAGVLSARQRR